MSWVVRDMPGSRYCSMVPPFNRNSAVPESSTAR
jgi:hypothetical protein